LNITHFAFNLLCLWWIH